MSSYTVDRYTVYIQLIYSRSTHSVYTAYTGESRDQAGKTRGWGSEGDHFRDDEGGGVHFERVAVAVPAPEHDGMHLEDGGLRVQGSGFRVEGAGFRVEG